MKSFSELVQRVLPGRISAAVQRCANPQCTRVVRTSGVLGRSRESIDLNGRWFCSPRCWRPALRDALRDSVQRSPAAGAHRHRIPLGLLLLSRQQISSDQLQRALQLQRIDPQKMIGESLIELGATTEQQVTAAVAAQWGCGTFSSSLPVRPVAEVPIELLRHYRMMPAHWNDRERVLHVGFLHKVDYLALAAMESVLDCRAVACFIADSHYRRVISGMGEPRESGQAAFGGGLSAREIAEIVFSYAEQIEADEIRVATTSAFIWVRMLAALPIDLTFQLG